MGGPFCPKCAESVCRCAPPATCPIPNCGFPATHHVIDGVFLCDAHGQRLEREVRATLDRWCRETSNDTPENR